MTQHQETAEQAAAFEAYYAMGAGRSLAKLRQHFIDIASETQPSLRTLQNWSKWFHWQQRVAIKDKAVAAGIDKKTTKANIDRKAKWLMETEKRIATAFLPNGDPKFPIEDHATLNATIKLALQLIGEPEEKAVNHHHEIQIIEIHEQKRKD